MHGSLDTQDFLRARNFDVVRKRCIVIGKTGAPRSSRKSDHPLAPRAAMQIYAQRWIPLPDRRPGRRQDLANCGVTVKHGAKPFLCDYANRQVRPRAFEHGQGGRGENAITQTAQAYHSHARSFGQLV
jgi:hypothetical protein